MASLRADPTYTVFIRLPFPRGDFVDPPPVNWDSSKDEALWDIISEVAKKTDIDWNEIALRFGVTVDFLLQQVDFLTQRHASQVRAQMRKARAQGSSAPSPVPDSAGAFAAEAFQRTGSALGRPRAPSGLSIRKDSPLPRNDGSVPGTPMRSTPRPQPTRTSSSNTAVMTMRNLGHSSSRASMRPGANPNNDSRRRLSSLPITTTVANEPTPQLTEQRESPVYASPGPADSPSSSSASPSESSTSSLPAQSRIIRRPPRFQSTAADAALPSEDDDDDDEEPAFLPYRPHVQNDGSHDLNATLRGSGTTRPEPRRLPNTQGRIHVSQTSESSTSSTGVMLRAPGSSTSTSRDLKGKGTSTSRPSTGPGPLSPRRTLELVGRSPSAGAKGKATSRSRDSDGTPSMGSSFSDLDDASVTQSALEEALASKLQDGGTIGSRMSTISNVFRSRYLPK